MTITKVEAARTIAATDTAQRLSATSQPLVWLLGYDDQGNSGATLWGFSETTCNFPMPISMPGVRNGFAVGVDAYDIWIKGTQDDIVNYKGESNT